MYIFKKIFGEVVFLQYESKIFWDKTQSVIYTLYQRWISLLCSGRYSNLTCTERNFSFSHLSLCFPIPWSKENLGNIYCEPHNMLLISFYRDLKWGYQPHSRLCSPWTPTVISRLKKSVPLEHTATSDSVASHSCWFPSYPQPSGTAFKSSGISQIRAGHHKCISGLF